MTVSPKDRRIEVDFYFGVGSRYSYLAATQEWRIEASGARLRWRPVYSPDLIGLVGRNPFAAYAERGQYVPAYRSEDARRWAAHYDVPYHEPDFAAFDWRRIALWAVAAGQLEDEPRFARWVLRRTFAEGHPPREQDLYEGAQKLGYDAAAIAAQVDDGSALTDHAASVQRALDRGAFGVPTFITDDGTLFWGQDRLPLLIDHLRGMIRSRG